MSPVDFSKAITTPDGVITKMSNQVEVHPYYRTDAYAVTVQFELNQAARTLLEALHERSDLREIHRSTRSFIDQMGLFGAHHDSTQIRFQNGTVELDTLVTLVDQSDGNNIVTSLRSVVGTGRAQYCRLLLTPEESKKSEKALDVLQRRIQFDHSLIQKDHLEKAWIGEMGGRATILSQNEKAKQVLAMPDEIQPGEFFLSETYAMDAGDPSSELLWILKRKARRGTWNNKTTIRHGDACGFDPYRSVGRRQGEFLNVGDAPVSTRNLRLIASQFEVDFENSHCEQMEGV